MFSQTNNRLMGIPSDVDTSTRVGFAPGDQRPMVTVQLKVTDPRAGTRTFDDPEQLLAFAQELTQAAKWLIDHGPRPKPRQRAGGR